MDAISLQFYNITHKTKELNPMHEKNKTKNLAYSRKPSDNVSAAAAVSGARVGIKDDCDYTKLEECEVHRIKLNTYMTNQIDTFKAREGPLLDRCV